MPRHGDHLRHGVFEPEDLAVVQQVFDQSCAELGTARNSPVASDLARVLLAAFIMGRRDKAGLRAIARGLGPDPARSGLPAYRGGPNKASPRQAALV